MPDDGLNALTVPLASHVADNALRLTMAIVTGRLLTTYSALVLFWRCFRFESVCAKEKGRKTECVVINGLWTKM